MIVITWDIGNAERQRNIGRQLKYSSARNYEAFPRLGSLEKGAVGQKILPRGGPGRFGGRTMGYALPCGYHRRKFRNVGSLATCSRCIPAVFSPSTPTTGPFESCWVVGLSAFAWTRYLCIGLFSSSLTLALRPRRLSLSLSRPPFSLPLCRPSCNRK